MRTFPFMLTHRRTMNSRVEHRARPDAVRAGFHGDRDGWSMPAKVIRLRYSGTCATCGAALHAGQAATWEAQARTTTCITCVRTIEPGAAGASARKEYERRRGRRAEKIEARWRRLAGVVKFMSDDPQSTKAWAKGSEGEQRLAHNLLRTVGDRAVLLHDRRVPGTRANIDHIVVAASGVWVIDAKNYEGLVEQRDVGGWFSIDERLFVANRDRTKLVDGLGRQVDAVRAALSGAEVPVIPVLCFVGADWKVFRKSFEVRSVRVTSGGNLSKMIAASGPLSSDAVARIGGLLASRLPPAS